MQFYRTIFQFPFAALRYCWPTGLLLASFGSIYLFFVSGTDTLFNRWFDAPALFLIGCFARLGIENYHGGITKGGYGKSISRCIRDSGYKFGIAFIAFFIGVVAISGSLFLWKPALSNVETVATGALASTILWLVFGFVSWWSIGDHGEFDDEISPQVSFVFISLNGLGLAAFGVTWSFWLALGLLFVGIAAGILAWTLLQALRYMLPRLWRYLASKPTLRRGATIAARRIERFFDWSWRLR